MERKTEKYAALKGTRCAANQGAEEAAEEMFGDGAIVPSTRSARYWNPDPEMIARWGEPIGTVTVHGPNTEYYVFRRNLGGRPSLDVKRHNITITDELWQKAEMIGGGNASDGIRKAIEAYE